MADDESPSTPSANAAVDAPESELNDQIRDAVSQLQSILEDADASTFQAAAYQTFVHVVSLAMHNAVAQQQQSHMLRMALTTAAANAILAGRKEEAESVLKLEQSLASTHDLANLLAQVRQFMETISRELAKSRAAAAPPAAGSAGS
jgi:hypothetical protein